MKNRSLSILSAVAISLSGLQSASALVSPNEKSYELSEGALQEFVTRNWGCKKFPFWNNVGKIERSTGIYIGNGHVLTAAHVGVGDFRANDGRLYKMVRGSGSILTNQTGAQADMLLFQIEVPRGTMVSKLPAIPLTSAAPARGERVLLMGAGAGKKLENGHPFCWNPDNQLRWGWNLVESVFTSPIKTEHYNSHGYATKFDRSTECQAAPGDSGGAVFRYNSRSQRWELGGVIIAVDDVHGRADFGSQTYIADPIVFAQRLAAAQKNGARPMLAMIR